jgi:glucosamine kinase
VRRVLAVDGGQSTIRVRHSGVPETIDLAGISHLEGDTVGSVAEAIIDGWRATGAQPVDRAVLGLTTAPADEASRQRLCEAVAAGVGAPEVWLADDAVTAHAGALSLGWGVSVTAGTGVACLAVPESGQPRIIGGHGFLLGDEGGAYWIGREGLRAVLRAADGREPTTALAEAAAQRFDGLDDLGARIHANDRPVDAIARFAPDVLDAADSGDPVASGIVEDAVAELVALVRTAVSSVGHAEAAAPVALGGRLLAGGPLRSGLDEALGSLSEVDARSAEGTPLDGAAMLGQADDPGRYRDLVYVRRARA